jgi:hypothetical protein
VFNEKCLCKHGSFARFLFELWAILFWKENYKNKVSARPQESVCLQIADSSVTDYTYKKFSKCCPCASHSALRVLLRIVTRSQKFHACYELTRIDLLPSVVVPLHH